MATAPKRRRTTEGDSRDLDFSQPFDKSDVVFVFDDKQRLYFNRTVLAFHSKVFDGMYSANWSEGRNVEKEIPLPKKSTEDFHTMLRFLKSYDAEALITERSLTPMLALADEYEIMPIMLACGVFILANWKWPRHKHIEAIVAASKYGLTNVAKAFIPLVATRDFGQDVAPLIPFVSKPIYAAILHCRMLRLTALARVRRVLDCYPACVHGDSKMRGLSFVCCNCCGTDKRCAAGTCLRDVKKPSKCLNCRSLATRAASLDTTCADCSKAIAGDKELCGCPIKDEEPVDAVIDMFLDQSA